MVVHNHVVFSLRTGQALDVGKHRYRDYNDSAIGQINGHSTTLHAEIKFFDAQIGVLVLAHSLITYIF